MSDRPVLVYDGDCGFCRRWVERWRRLTGDRVEYLPAGEAAERFPRIPAGRLERAAAFVSPAGEVSFGAEAVLRALQHAPGHGWKLRAYRALPGAAPAAEGVYAFVARHRRGLSTLTRLLCGPDPAPPTWDLSRWLFLRALGAVFLVAFLSLWVQVHGLVGEQGILPAADFLEWARTNLGGECYRRLPTIAWLGAGDGVLHALCAAGTVLSVLLIAGVAPVPVLGLLWASYLSLVVIGQAFLAFQWDSLLLEAALGAMFLAPLEWRPRLAGRRRPPRTGLWLQRWLLFKLVFLSGVTKLLSGDPTWRDLTALDYHYETQPLPSWIGWYAHQLPEGLQRISVAGMYVVEIGLPLLILAPRRLRHAAAVGLVGLQVMIALAGSYGFFNVLAAALCLLIVDDAALRRVLPRPFARRFAGPPRPGGGRVARRLARGAAAAVMVVSVLAFLREMVRTQDRSSLPAAVVGVLDAGNRVVLHHGGHALLDLTDPFRSANGYGLFRVMTTRRPEIVIEGSRDGLTWHEYGFRWKPGDVTRRPRYAAPHMPRLDWQMWFAALNPYGSAYWLRGLGARILEGSPPVLELLGENPFPDDTPPTRLRLMYYEYTFTDARTRGETGAWWRRELRGPLMTFQE